VQSKQRAGADEQLMNHLHKQEGAGLLAVVDGDMAQRQITPPTAMRKTAR
jgi:hypothetical protein